MRLLHITCGISNVLIYPPAQARCRQVLCRPSQTSTSKPSVYSNRFLTHSRCPYRHAICTGNIPSTPALNRRKCRISVRVNTGAVNIA